MLKKTASIIKYEWLRRWKFFLAGLAIFTLANIDLTSSTISNGPPRLISLLLVSLLFIMAGILGFDHLTRLYKPLFSDEGTFVFSVPLNGYQLLGGKVLAVALECVGVALFVALVAFIDFLVLGGHLTEIRIPDGISMAMILERGLQLGLLLLLGYLSFILTAYLSMALAKSLFSSVKYGGLLSFVIFIVITRLFSLIGVALRYADLRIEGPVVTGYWGLVAIMAAVVAVVFAATGYLLDRKVNIQ